MRRHDTSLSPPQGKKGGGDERGYVAVGKGWKKGREGRWGKGWARGRERRKGKWVNTRPSKPKCYEMPRGRKRRRCSRGLNSCDDYIARTYIPPPSLKPLHTSPPCKSHTPPSLPRPSLRASPAYPAPVSGGGAHQRPEALSFTTWRVIYHRAIVISNFKNDTEPITDRP